MFRFLSGLIFIVLAVFSVAGQSDAARDAKWRDDLHTLATDISASVSSADYVNGRDVVLEAVLAYRGKK